MTGAAALVLTGALGGAPVANADPGVGTLTVNVVDDLGKPVKAVVVLIDPDGNDYDLSLPAPVGSTFTHDLPEGDYAVVAFGGWNGITCAGTETCEIGVTGPTDLPVYKAAALHVESGKPTTYIVKTQTPKLTGAGAVGETLEIDVPDAMGGSGLGMLASLEFMGAPTSPGVTWLRDGKRIVGERDTVYTLTGADVGRNVTATVTYPALYRMLFASITSGQDISPAPATLGPIVAAKNQSTTSVEVVGKPQASKPTTAWITVTGAASGWVEVRATGVSPARVRLRDGFAQVKLQLRAGKRTVTASYLGSSAVNPSSDATTVKVKKARHKKHKK